MVKTSLVSVCIPTCNHARYLGEAIKSVLDQTFTDFELIISDNASTDNTEEVVRLFKDRRIRYYKNKTNIGMYANFNECIEYSKGKYLKFLCDDDLLTSQALEKMVSVAQTNENIGIISGVSMLLFSTGQKFIDNPFNRFFIADGKEFLEECLIRDGRGSVMGNPSCVMVKRSCFNVLGKFLEIPKSGWGNDHEMWLRILTAFDIACIPEVLCVVRRHLDTSSVLVKSLQTEIDDLYLILRRVRYNVHYKGVRNSCKQLAKGRITIAALIKSCSCLRQKQLLQAIHYIKNIMKNDVMFQGLFWRIMYKMLQSNTLKLKYLIS